MFCYALHNGQASCLAHIFKHWYDSPHPAHSHSFQHCINFYTVHSLLFLHPHSSIWLQRPISPFHWTRVLILQLLPHSGEGGQPTPLRRSLWSINQSVEYPQWHLGHIVKGRRILRLIHQSGNTHAATLSDCLPASPLPSLHNSMDIQGLSTTLFEPLLMKGSTKSSHHVCTAKLGNPQITVVHQSGIFDMEILYCICPNAVEKDEQLINVGLFPSTFKQIETTFTFAVLDDFLTDNLECKTTAQQYYSKLQSITYWVFPDSVTVGYHPFVDKCWAHLAALWTLGTWTLRLDYGLVD